MFLPDTIPCAFGSVAGPAAPTTGNGWEVLVLAHTDFHSYVCEIPGWLSLQFAKILSDKGSGTIVLNMDDEQLFPPDVLSLSPNPDLAQGIQDWVPTGAILEEVLPGPPGGPLPQSMFIVPDGVSQNSYAGQANDPIPVIPGQRYAMRAEIYSPAGYGNVIAGMAFSDGYGDITVDVTAAAVPAGLWLPYGAVATAPQGAVTGWPVIGLGSSPGGSDTLYATAFVVSYESLEDTTLPGAAAAPAALPQPPPIGSTTTGAYLLDYEHLWQVYREGKLLFEFTGQSVTEQLVDSSEQRQATITGPGTVATLGWARAMPPGFPEIVFKTDAIQDGFAEVDDEGNPALDTNIWDESGPLDHILLNPPGTCMLIATGGTTSLGATPYDITGSSISAQINPPVPLDAGTTMDGSQVFQLYVQSADNPTEYALIGLSATSFYAQVADAHFYINPFTGGPSTKTFGKYNSTDDLYWRISENNGNFSFWTSADGQSWVLQWQVPYHWDASKVTVFFAVSYSTDDVIAAGVSNINADIVTPTSAGNIFLLTPIMSVWLQLFQQAQQRGTIPWVTTRMSEIADSFGNPWTDAMSVQIQNGTDLLSLLQTHAGIVDADWIMQPGFQLEVGLPLQGAGSVSLGRDRSAEVILRESKELTTRQRVRARDQVANSTGAVNTDGTVVSAIDPVSISRYQQREGWVQTAQAVNDQSMQVVIAATIAASKDEVLSETISVLPDRPGSTPLEDFDCGDWVGRERPSVGFSVVDAIRIIGITFGIDSTGAVTSELTVSTYRQYIAQQLTYLVNKFGGQFINALGTTPVTSIGGLGSTPTVVSPSLGGLADVQTGTDEGDPLVYNNQAGEWQNASSSALSGNPVPLAVGPEGGPKALLVHASGQTLSVDGGTPGTLTSAFQGATQGASESAPCGVSPVIFNAGAANEQLGVLFAAGMSGRATYAVLLTGLSADATTTGRFRIGSLAVGGSSTWAFTTIQAF